MRRRFRRNLQAFMQGVNTKLPRALARGNSYLFTGGMMEENNEPQDDLQFDKVNSKDIQSGQSICEICKNSMMGVYYRLNNTISCDACKNKTEQSFSESRSSNKFLKALGFGIPAAILGAGIYYLIQAVTGYEIGLVAIVIGWMVGSAIRKSTNNLGGRGYQILAVLLTYMAICSTYVPSLVQNDKLLKMEVLRAAQSNQQTDPAIQEYNFEENYGSKTFKQIVMYYGILYIFSLALPFLTGLKNIIGLLIIGFGLFEAWRINTRAVLQIEGPFELKKA